MLKLFIKLLKFLLLIILTIIISLKYYEIIYFKPYISYINERYTQGKREVYFTEKIRDIVSCLETSELGKDSPYISNAIARHFVYEFIEFDTKIKWHFHNLLWSKLLVYHFDKEQLFILYIYLTPFELVELDFGLENSSQYYFNKKISKLTTKEFFVLLGMTKSPIMHSSSNCFTK